MHGMCCDESGRMFLTKEEKMERLKDYREWLSNELKGVEEVITEMKKTK